MSGVFPPHLEKWSTRMQNAYPVFVQSDDGDLVVRSRDLPELLTFGHDEAEALANAAEALEVVALTYVEKGLPLPSPSKPQEGERLVYLSAPVAAKLAVWQAFVASGLSKSELARRMGVAEGEVRRILDPDYGSKLDKLDLAARALGMRLVVSAEAA